MTFVYNDEVKIILRQSRIRRKDYFFSGAGFFVIVIVSRNRLTFQKSEKSLNGRDYNIGILWYGRRFQARHAKDGIKRVACLCQSVSAKFSFSLLAKVVTVNKEKHSPHFGIIQKAIGCGDGCICFACACSQYHKSAILTSAERFFKFGDCFKLTVT